LGFRRSKPPKRGVRFAQKTSIDPGAGPTRAGYSTGYPFSFFIQRQRRKRASNREKKGSR
jgi:hypothetical protein